MSQIYSIVSYFRDSQYIDIFTATIILALTGLVIWFMYKQLSKRDLFKIEAPKKQENKFINFIRHLIYALKYAAVFPVYTFIWFLVFSIFLHLLSPGQEISKTMLLGIVVISSIRILAYINEGMAEDLAKLLPLTLIAAVLANPEFFIQKFSFSSLLVFKTETPKIVKFLLFTVLLEWILRLGHGFFMLIKDKFRK